EAGCGLVLLANKWDLMDDEARRQFGGDLERKLYFVDWAPLLRVSAPPGRGRAAPAPPPRAPQRVAGAGPRAHAPAPGARALGEGPLRHPGPGRPAGAGPVHQRSAHPQLPPPPGAGPAAHLRVRGHAFAPV